MQSALAIARQGLGRVWPNPAVGCVIVKNGIVISQARTADTGRPHAETIAISKSYVDVSGSDMYVTLEPCAHTGKTPPCCEAIVSSRFRRVIIAVADTDQRTAGLGIRAIQRAGIEVRTGLFADMARDVNRGYFLNRALGRPMFTLKIAASLDAKTAMAGGESKWITSALSRRRVHLERYQHDAVLTGIGTVIADDPELTTRLKGVHCSSPRIVIDTRLRFPVRNRLLETLDLGPVWVFTCSSQNNKKYQELVDKGVEIFCVPHDNNGHCDLNSVAGILGQKGLTRVFVEAGGGLAASFITNKLCDRLLLFRSPAVIGGDGLSLIGGIGGTDLASLPVFTRKEIHLSGDDCLEIFDFNA